MLRTASILLVLSYAVAPAAAQSLNLRDLAVAPVATTQGVALEGWLDHANAIYAEGEAVQASVRPGADGYLTAFSIGPTGDVVRIFPNAYQPYNAVRAGEIVSIPGAAARAVVSGPLGEERIRIVLTSGPGAVCSPSELSSVGPFSRVIGGASALQRDLSVAAAGGDAGAILAAGDITFQTAPAGVAGNASSIVVVSGGGYRAPAVPSVVIVPQGSYPLPRR